MSNPKGIYFTAIHNEMHIFVDKTTFNNRKEKKCLHVLVFQETEQSKLSNNPKCSKGSDYKNVLMTLH